MGLEPEDLYIKEPLGYPDFLQLLSNAALVLTDSGGVQQESCSLGTRCVTLRESTEWTETIELKMNFLSRTDPAKMVDGVRRMLTADRNSDMTSLFGGGNSAKLINDMIQREFRLLRQR